MSHHYNFSGTMHAQMMDSDTSKKAAEVLANIVPARTPSGNLKDNAAFVASPKDHVAGTPISTPGGTPKSTEDAVGEMCEDFKPGTNQYPIRALAQHWIHSCPLYGRGA